MVTLSAFDKDLLNLLQNQLPVCSHPFAFLASELGTDEATVLSHLKNLKQEGYLRRIGTFFNSNRLGYHSTLVALEVSPESVPAVAKSINRYPGATHNYEREGKYNLWFTLSTPTQEAEHRILEEIRKEPGILSMMNLKSRKKYKINVRFHLQ